MSGSQGCPGSRTISYDDNSEGMGGGTARVPSQLRQWPIQLHLVSPAAPYYQGAEVLLAADCVPFAVGSFHQDMLKGKALAIACPKLDTGQEVYTEKIKGWFEESNISSLTVVIMEVPCCRGLAQLAIRAWEESSRKVPVKAVVVGLRGDVLQEEWLRI
jgi:hypothetical protein